MASSSTCKPEPLKRLVELLQEQQEPFHIDDFLKERGHLKKAMNLKDTRDKTSFKNMETFSTGKLKQRKGGIPHCAKVLKFVVDKLISVNEHQKTPFDHNRALRGRKIGVCGRDESSCTFRESDLVSYSNSVSDFEASSENGHNSSSCHHTSMGGSQPLKLRDLKQQIITYGVHQWGCMEDNKQRSPVSVLEQQHTQESFWFQRETPTTSTLKLQKKFTEDSVFTAALRALHGHSTTSRDHPIRVIRPQESRNTVSSQHVKKKRAPEQTKLLLMDCIKEAVENSTCRNKNKTRKEGLKQQVQEFLGAEKVERFSLLAKQSKNMKHIAHLISSDLWNPKDGWIDLKPQMRQIGLQIECIIWGDMRNEIVLDLMAIEIKR